MSWIRLAKILLVVIITFNRRRAGGVSKMKLSEFDSVSKTSVNDAVEGSLSKLEQKLSISFYRLEIAAKRGNIVPILLTKEKKKHLDLLVKLRSKVVMDANPYMFPRINYGSVSHLKGSECLRKLAEECGAKEQGGAMLDFSSKTHRNDVPDTKSKRK